MRFVFRNPDLPEGAEEEGRAEGGVRVQRRAQESPPRAGNTTPQVSTFPRRTDSDRSDVPPAGSVQSGVEIVAIDVRNNDLTYENGRVEIRSPSHFHLDLSPNLNRPEHIYESTEEPSTSAGSSSTAPTHWRFKMFKTGSKNSKQNGSRDGNIKNRNNCSFGEYDIPKISGKMTDKCFPSKAKNKSKISPLANSCNEQSGPSGGSPIGLNVCFGKQLLRSPSNSQTLEFNDRSGENSRAEGSAEQRRDGSASCGRGDTAPRSGGSGGSVYGRLGNTYGRLQVLGSGIGRIERHLSSSCGNIDHYCAPIQGNPRFRIENQAVEADRVYQEPPAGLKGISKGSLQWLMVNRWLPLWVANSGGKNEYKVLDLDFSIYDDVRYPTCTSACNDDHCLARNAEVYSAQQRNYLAGGHPENSGVSPGGCLNDQASGSVDCESPEPDSWDGQGDRMNGQVGQDGPSEHHLVGQDSLGDNDLSVTENEQSISECTASSSSETSSPANEASHSSQPNNSA